MIIVILMNFLFAIATTVGMTIIPLLVTENLGLSLFILGIIEGGTELLSNILRLTSGNLFDIMKNRRLLFVIPSILAFASKILLYFPHAITILGSKIVERISNGSFAVPRDAYIGERAEDNKKGIALGLLSSSKSLGCVLGPLLVSGVVLLLGPLQQSMKYAILLACTFSFIAFLFSFFVDTKRKIDFTQKRQKFSFKELKPVLKHLQLLFVLSTLFFLGRFNDGVIMLYLKKEGFPEWFYLATIGSFNFTMLIVSPLIGLLVDKRKEYAVLLLTITALLFFNILYYFLPFMPWMFACLGLMCWGVQRVGAQIIFSAMIFKSAPVQYYGTTIGTYSVLSGIGVFVASVISGHLAQISFSYVFILSGIFALCTLILILYFSKSEHLRDVKQSVL